MKPGQLQSLLILAGPQVQTQREPLAWLGYPATAQTAGFDAKPGEPRAVQAWKAAIVQAAGHVGRRAEHIGYTIHDAGQGSDTASQRLASLAQTLTDEVPEFDPLTHGFNTAAVLGDMGAGSALTNVLLAIGYANHVGKTVLVADTTEPERPVALLVLPPEKVRPVRHDQPWFRARGENNAYLPWWGLRLDAPPYPQGFSK